MIAPKTLHRMNIKLTALLFLAFGFTQVSAQQISSRFSARERGWWTFGIDGGLAYQSADVSTRFNGWGAGLTLGKNLFYRPGGALSFDLRARGLFTRTYGLDATRSFGIQRNDALNGSYAPSLDYLRDESAPNDSSFVYHNYRHSMGELGLEGVLTFNRLRERTGVVLSLFGGIGVDFYKINTDQLDGNGNVYNYLIINNNNSKNIILADLSGLRDGAYESPADGFTENSLKAGFMPGAGIELGYQVAPRFVIGIGHKITFSRTDILDGQRWTNNNAPTGDNDWQHYTNVHFRWDISPQEKRVAAPRIEVVNPGSNPYVTSYSNENLHARIHNVHAYADVQCYLNGSNQPFTFDKSRLSADLRLRPGRNEARIVATNPAGRDEETVIIVLEDRYTPAPPVYPPPGTPAQPPPQTMQRPEVRIVQPTRSPSTTDRDNVQIIAQLRNVSDRRDVRLYVNGADERFTLAEGLEANVRLREGRNAIRVEAETPAGRASDEVEVIYQRNTTPTTPTTPQGQRPTVRITQPRNANETVSQANYTLKATVEQVDNRDDVTVYLNGNVLRSVSFDPRTRVLSAELTLRDGNNSITIRARNRYGEGEASASITKNVVQQKPDVTITEPRDGASFRQPGATLRATTRNVGSRNDITLELNRRTIPFNFDQNTGAVSADLTLQEGENTVSITAKNGAGSDQASVKLNYLTARPPKVTITEPANNSETRTAQGQLTATLVHVDNKNDVTAFLNGTSVPFSFDPKKKQISAKVNYAEGNNTLRVAVRTDAGSAEATATVRFVKAKPPVVTITNPRGRKPTTDKPAFILTATVTNVFSDKNVQVSHNGAAVSGFALDRGGNLSANVTLKPGKNTFVVKATTTDGSAEASASVELAVAPTVPVPVISKPELEFVTPRRTGLTVTETSYALKATAKNVTDKSQIKLKVNGGYVRDFEYTPRGSNVTANLNLKQGKNTIVVEATTPGGSATIQAEITYQVKSSVPKPEVAIESASQPTVSPFNPNEGRSSVVANVRYIDAREQISVKVNDTAVTDFTFNASTAKVTWVSVLRKGDNRIDITVTNAAGTAMATRNVKFE